MLTVNRQRQFQVGKHERIISLDEATSLNFQRMAAFEFQMATKNPILTHWLSIKDWQARVITEIQDKKNVLLSVENLL